MILSGWWCSPAVPRGLHDTICYPDKGATDKYYSSFPYHASVVCTKNRDPLTGYISEITCKGSIKNRKILIIDDICDGGMTFILIAKKLLKEGALTVSLYVSHGIFSKGKKVLHNSGILNIYVPGRDE